MSKFLKLLLFNLEAFEAFRGNDEYLLDLISLSLSSGLPSGSAKEGVRLMLNLERRDLVLDTPGFSSLTAEVSFLGIGSFLESSLELVELLSSK